jgi:hypothetical protein
MVTYKKVGGLHFFKCGRYGVSFYASKKKARQVWRDASGASIGDYVFAVCLGIVGGVALFYGL